MNQRETVERERLSLLAVVENALEIPMLVLGFAWLVLTIVEFTRGLSPFLLKLNDVIWFTFLVDFVVKLILAPAKLHYLRKNWLTAIALAVPALRLLRFARALNALRILRATRGVRLVKVLGTFNRGMRALGASLGRRGFGYVIALSSLVTLLGAAGILAFERETSTYIHDYGTALWWTAMMLTTMGSDYFPVTPEGRMLGLLLAIYGFAVFGYVTATVASFFVERESATGDSNVASQETLEEIKRELRSLREELRAAQSRSDIPTQSPSP